MTTTQDPAGREQMHDAVEDAYLPASEARGTPGRETATELARGARLLRLRSARMTYDQIAEAEGYSDRSTARQALKRALDRHEAENASELRTLENLAMDADERRLRTIIENSASPVNAVIRAIDARTRLSARRSRLNGLDAPVQVAISAGVAANLADALAEAESVLIRGDVTDVHTITDLPK